MKTCKQCEQSKPLDEFYLYGKVKKRPAGKCKACVRLAVEERRKRLEATDLNWVLAEKERHRAKSAKARAEGRVSKQSPEKRRESLSKSNAKHREKQRARVKVARAIRAGVLKRELCHCGQPAHAHHDDHSKPLEVTWLCPKHHAERDVQLRRQKLVNSAVFLGFGFM